MVKSYNFFIYNNRDRSVEITLITTLGDSSDVEFIYINKLPAKKANNLKNSLTLQIILLKFYFFLQF